MQTMPFEGQVPTPKGRDRLYPLHTMEVGEFFFLPDHPRKNFSSYISHQSRKLGRKFATRTLVMRQDDDGKWIEAKWSETGAHKGIGVYRTE